MTGRVRNIRGRLAWTMDGWTDFSSGNTAIANRTVNSGHAPSVNHQFEMQPEGLREMFRNRYPGKIEFRLTARDLEKDRLLDLNIEDERALPLGPGNPRCLHI